MIRVDESDPVGEVEPSFPYRDVTVRRGVDFKENYEIQSEIGRGKFGTVYHCKEKTTGLFLAAKVVTTTRKEDRRSVEREVEIMRRLQHPRLIQLYDAIDNGKQFYVILELIQGGELFERVIDDDFVLTERSCAVFMRQICEGIEFVHSQYILHLDMKPENILCLTKEGNRIKIIDFGLARQYDPKKKMQVLFGTPEFVAPEVVNFDQIGFGTDMWSIGVICYVLLSGLSPFMGDTDVETMANVTIAKYDFDHDAFADISEDAKDFIRSLLIKDKEKRASATICRNHRWLAPRMPPRKTTKDPGGATESSNPEKRARLKEAEGGSKDELDVTKDNLRLFVERWREHPNSPYQLDNEGVIVRGTETNWSGRPDNNLETISLRGQSPSPCGSVCSTSSESSEQRPEQTNSLLAVPNSIVLGLERRASEGNFGNSAHSRRDPAVQIVLAEEIIKLSEHLRSLAMGQLGDEALAAREDAEQLRNDREDDARSKGSPARADSKRETNEISEKLSTIARQRKINGTTFNGGRTGTYDSNKSSSLTSFSLKKTSLLSNKTSRRPDPSRRDDSAHERSNQENSNNQEERSKKVTWSIENKRDEIDEETPADRLSSIDLTPPWRRSRTIRRFGETCRDVPRISNLRDIHKNLNLNEPTSAKDLLLQLLNEWDDTSRPSGVGRKSVSVDWCGEESVARRSINSLAEYFQSERDKTTPCVPAATTSSVNR